MSYQVLTPQKLAAKLRNHHNELALHYTAGTVAQFEPEWMTANESLEDAMVRALEFQDQEILEQALKEHMMACYRLMQRFERQRMNDRLKELERLLA